MRGRRNTNLSTSSSSSSDASSTTSPRLSSSEKHVDDDIELGGSQCKTLKQAPTSRRRLFVRLAILSVVTIFIAPQLLCRGLHRQFTSPSLDSRLTPINSTTPERISFVDRAGRDRWTISIAQNTPFPLTVNQYESLCKSDPSTSTGFQSFLATLLPSSQTEEALYLDPADAYATGVLSTSEDTKHKICHSSLTFSIDPSEASFGKTLLMLWLSYGIAKEEGRAFFVDDSNWAYGRLSTYFSNIPKPDCTPPPKSYIVPCPSTTRHLLVSAATARWSLQPRLDALQRSWSWSFSQNHKIFELLRTGYEALYSVPEDDKQYAAHRSAMLKAEAASRTQPLIGMQIRRGDMHPFELQFSQDYLPLERYADAAKHLLRSSKSNTTASVIMASDDPDLISKPELSLAVTPLHVQRAQERIQLATKAALDRDSPAQPIRQPGSAYVKHIDENAGWDGGFYRSLFLSLGSLNRLHHVTRDQQPTMDSMRMRELVARSYLLDLEVLRHADGVVCAVSSAACRVLGVMMGWDAVQQGRWVNVDDGRPWTWNGGT